MSFDECLKKALGEVVQNQECDCDEEYDDECEHKWVFQGSDYKKYQPNDYITEYKRIDTYYCEKCLEVKEIVAKQEEIIKRGIWVEKPYWFKEC